MALGALDRWPVRFGDIDQDLEVGFPVSAIAFRLAVGLDGLTFTSNLLADVDGDQQVSLGDSWLIARYVLGWVDFFPVDPAPVVRPATPTSTPGSATTPASATPTALPLPTTLTPTHTPPPPIPMTVTPSRTPTPPPIPS